MIKLLNSSGIINIKENDNKNYDFSVGKQKVLCLNRRLIEIGIGTCVAYSATNVYTQYALEVSAIPRIAVGLASVSSIAGYDGWKFLLLTSSLLQVNPVIPNLTLEGFTLIPTLITLAVYLLFIGEGLILASSGCALLIALSFIIKKCEPKYLNTLLNHFNNQQNIVKMGALEIKNNLEYQLSIFGRDILCLKKIVLQIGAILGFILAFSIEISFEGRIDGLLGILLHMTGLLLTHKTLGDKIYLIPMLVITLAVFDPPMYNMYWSACEFFITTFAGGIILAGSFFGALDLLSSLAKKSENQQIKKIGKYFDQLKDKQKIKEHDQYIKSQKLKIEQRAEYIKARNAEIIASWTKESANHLEKKADDKKETNEISSIDKKIKTKTKGLDNKQINPKANDKKLISLKTQKKYSVNLGQSEKTWNRLFDDTRSKPDHFAIKGTKIETLITALGGTTTPAGKKKIGIWFGNKRWSTYEVAHGSDKGLISADYALRIKRAIDAAIDAGVISTDKVKIIA